MSTNQNQNLLHFFVADKLKKIVTHKPALLCFTVIHNGNVKMYTVPTKISASKIKRRCNRKTKLKCAWVDCAGTDTVYTSIEDTYGKDVLSIQADSNVRPENMGFLFYVETKGGKTEGRQKQRYLLLRLDSHYVLRSKFGGSVVNVHLKTKTGEILYLSHSATQQVLFHNVNLPQTSLVQPKSFASTGSTVSAPSFPSIQPFFPPSNNSLIPFSTSPQPLLPLSPKSYFPSAHSPFSLPPSPVIATPPTSDDETEGSDSDFTPKRVHSRSISLDASNDDLIRQPKRRKFEITSQWSGEMKDFSSNFLEMNVPTSSALGFPNLCFNEEKDFPFPNLTSFTDDDCSSVSSLEESSENVFAVNNMENDLNSFNLPSSDFLMDPIDLKVNSGPLSKSNDALLDLRSLIAEQFGFSGQSSDTAKSSLDHDWFSQVGFLR